EAERERARGGIRKNVADDVIGARIDCLRGGRLPINVRLPVMTLRMNGTDRAVVRQRAIGIRELQQRHLGAAQRERIAVVIRIAPERVEPETFELAIEGLVAEKLERAHGRNVERRSECLAQRDLAFESAIVVLRHIESRRQRYRQRGIVEYRGG